MSSGKGDVMKEFAKLDTMTADEVWRRLVAHMFICDNPYSSVELELASAKEPETTVKVKLDLIIREIDGVATVLDREPKEVS